MISLRPLRPRIKTAYAFLLSTAVFISWLALPAKSSILFETASASTTVASNSKDSARHKDAVQPLSSPGAISFTAPTSSVNEGDGTATATLTRTGGADTEVVAKVTITDISTSPADYHFAPGTQDTTFGEAGLGFRGDVWALALQPDGKVIVGGNFSKYNGIDIISIARLNADGTLDTTFNQGGFGTDATIFDIVLQPDGKILIAGSFTQYNRVARSRIARLNADGTLDTTFSQT
ncbi:MAG TPA: hypothetical protein VE842_03955, partial [Pyrinomonadaceae bacterium]|nr:hypothetical protein [Pyrinomonadaceae bacterium]